MELWCNELKEEIKDDIFKDHGCGVRNMCAGCHELESEDDFRYWCELNQADSMVYNNMGMCGGPYYFDFSSDCEYRKVRFSETVCTYDGECDFKGRV